MRYNPNGRIGNDFLFLFLFGFVFMVILMIPFITIPEKEDAKAPPPQGSITVEAFWQDDLNTDVDLWTKAPKDRPVGYSNKGGVVFNLLRDDLGTANDVSGKNLEISYTRGRPDGEYIVNLHLFRVGDAALPLKVKVIVSGKINDGASYTQYFYSDVVLEHEGHQLTVVRFQVKDGKVLMDSLNRIPAQLREPSRVGDMQ